MHPVFARELASENTPKSDDVICSNLVSLGKHRTFLTKRGKVYQQSGHRIVRSRLDQLNRRRPGYWPARDRTCELQVGILCEVLLEEREYSNRRNDCCDKYAYRTGVATAHWCRSGRRTWRNILLPFLKMPRTAQSKLLRLMKR